MAALIAITTLLTRRIAPSLVNEDSQPRLSSMLFNLVTGAVFAAAGGYVTACIARENPIVHAMSLALAVLILSALSALQSRGKHPVSYQLALTAITPLAVLGGGLLRLKQLGMI